MTCLSENFVLKGRYSRMYLQNFFALHICDVTVPVASLSKNITIAFLKFISIFYQRMKRVLAKNAMQKNVTAKSEPIEQPIERSN
jgi:hypothetical protein